MTLDRKFLVMAFVYAALGMLLGIHMAASHNHVQHVTHAHILLVGFVLSLAYAIVHKLWLGPMGVIATVQFYLHQLGAIVLVGGLYVLYGRILPEPQIGPILGIASLVVFSAVLVMLYMLVKSLRRNATHHA